MRLRTRLPTALVLVALFVAMPAPGPSQNLEVAPILVRDWLAGDGSPLAAWRRDGTVPPLLVDLRTSPPIEDDGARRAAAASYARAADDWAKARSAAGEPTRVDAGHGALPLLVHVGERGVSVQLSSPSGQVAQFGRAFPTRLSLLPALVVLAGALLLRRLLPALFAAGLAGAIVHAATASGLAVNALDAVTRGLTTFAADTLWRALREPLHVCLLPAAALLALATSMLPSRVPSLATPRARTALPWLTDAAILAAAGLFVPHTPAAPFAWHLVLTAVLLAATLPARRDEAPVQPGPRAVARAVLRAIGLLLLVWSVQRVSDDLGAGALLAAAAG